MNGDERLWAAERPPPEAEPGTASERAVYDRHIAIGYSPVEARRKVADYRRANTAAARNAATISRIRGYAAKWGAEHAGAEPPVHEDPTDAALAACFAGCARPARPAEYDAIRAAIRGQW